jgi:hypothetical protein
MQFKKLMDAGVPVRTSISVPLTVSLTKFRSPQTENGEKPVSEALRIVDQSSLSF